MPARPADPDETAVPPPESQAIAVGDAVDAVSREEQLAQVFPSPPVGPEPVFRAAGAGRSGRREAADRPASRLGGIEEEVAKIEVFVEDAGRVQASR